MKADCQPAATTSRIVMLFAAEEAPEIEFQVVDLFTGEHMKPPYSAMNPSCLVPMLEDGDFRLTESSAILKYLADKAGSPAYPKDLKARARVHERMDWFNSNIYKDFAYGVIYPQTFPHHKRPGDAVQAGTLEWGKQKTQAWLKILDQDLIGPKKRFLCGDQVTIADYMGAEMIALGGLTRCNLSAYPNGERWLRNMKALKSWAKVNEAFYGFAGSLKDAKFVAI